MRDLLETIKKYTLNWNNTQRFKTIKHTYKILRGKIKCKNN